MAAPRRNGPGADLWAVERPASDRAKSRPRPHRRGGAAWQRTVEQETGRYRLAAETAPRAAQSFAWAPGADRAGGGEEETQARRQAGSGFVSGADQPRRGRFGVHAVAAFLGAPRSSLRPAGNGGDRKTVADARTDPCVSHRSSRLDCDCAGERAAPQRTCRLPRRGPLGHQSRLSRCEGLTDWLRTNAASRAFSSGYSCHAAIV